MAKIPIKAGTRGDYPNGDGDRDRFRPHRDGGCPRLANGGGGGG